MNEIGNRGLAGVGARAGRFERWRHRLADSPSSLETDVRAGLRLGCFYLLYQPRHALDTGDVRAVESLLRWRDVRRGEMNPGLFLAPLADSSVMAHLGRWVVQQASIQARAWELARPTGAEPIAVAVNVVASELLNDGFVEFVAATIEVAELDPGLLQFELDFRSINAAAPVLATRLEALRRLGVGVGIDGVGPSFGEGGFFLPCRTINVARRWIRTIDGDGQTAAGVHALIERAHDAGVQVCAVGVERAAQADALKVMGCDLVQGFHYSEPVEPTELGWQDDRPKHHGPSPTASQRAARRHHDAESVGAAADAAGSAGDGRLPRRAGRSTSAAR